MLNIKQDAYLDRIEQDEEESVDGVPQVSKLILGIISREHNYS